MKSENVVQIRYCCISYRDVILVSHQTEAENYTPMVHSILRTLDIREDRKLASPVDRFQVHVLIESGIAYTCVTHLTNKHYLQFSFLETMKEKFLEVPSLHIRAVTASENEFERDFCPVIASVVYDYNIGRGDNVSRLHAQVEDVKQIMLENVEKVIERGDRLDDLLSKTEDLESHVSIISGNIRII
ncbi:vesicle-associated membrane protein 712-like isoform X1 [Zootermopsis nevadensis]|uniref:vesicle-associated membrane protein 712-like isoform X1 n=2 Tax=Zootermopsis nevadensis TaxID=136037 RepID=UPI000B8E9969|nr:vesicle-associated membrane protein 712-like isoform X1 [Zootermopsis nevadensis]